MTGNSLGGGREDGAVMLMVVITMFVFVGLLALVIDIGLLRADRRTDRLAADAAVTAGVVDLDPFAGGDGQQACATAWDYLVLNVSDGQATATPPNCAGLAGVCDAAAARTVTGSVGQYEFEIVQPVPDGHAFMAGQALNSEIDGGPCQRLGVRIVKERDFSFASLLGMGSSETDVSAVARIGVGIGAEELVPLLLLEPIGCDALFTSGQGKVTVDYFEDTPGYILVDSDASKTSNPNRCSNNSWSIDSKGTQNGWIRALPAPGQGLTSAILSYALSGASSANPAAAYDPSDLTSAATDGNGVVLTGPAASWFRLYPTPFPSSRRITRGPIDWRYNCKASYPDYDLDAPGSGGVPVGGCRDTATRSPYIDILRAAYGDVDRVGVQPPGFQRWTDAHTCAYQPSDPPVVVNGDWWIDCPGGFTVNNDVRFSGGSVVADGPIDVLGGSLTINSGTAGDEMVYLRSGRLYKVAQAALSMEQTFVYLADGWIDFGGGSGGLTWTAPLAGDFEDLALWSESREVHALGGQAGNDLEGTLFTPNADPFVLTGQSGQFQTAAQFLTRRLEIKGQGEVQMHPSPDRSTLIPVRSILLIR